MLKGFEQLKEADVTGHTACRFGKWYHDAGNPLKNERAFTELDAPHQKVHEAAYKAVAAYNAGNIKEAEKLYGEVESSSGKVLYLLDQLINKVRK